MYLTKKILVIFLLTITCNEKGVFASEGYSAREINSVTWDNMEKAAQKLIEQNQNYSEKDLPVKINEAVSLYFNLNEQFTMETIVASMYSRMNPKAAPFQSTRRWDALKRKSSK